MSILANKNGIVFGVANQRSIAWACAKAAADAGARLALTYQGERLKENVEKLTRDMPGTVLVPCDVADQSQVDAAFEHVGREFGRLDFLVHSIAYAPKAALEGAFADTDHESFRTALEISAYSLTQLTRAAAPLMTEGGSVVSMTYLGAERVVPNYNVMGVAKAALEASTRYLAADLGPRNIRVNTVSAGPIPTLAARGVSDMSKLLKHVAERAPLKRNIEAREVGNTALFLCSDLSSGITGEVIHVDCGFNIMAI